MRLSDVFRFCSNAHGPSPDSKASAAAPAAAQRSFLLAVPPAADEVLALEHARGCSLGLPAASQAARMLQWPPRVPWCSEPTALLGWETCPAAAEQGAEAGAPGLHAREHFSPAPDGLCPLGQRQRDWGAERVPSGVGGWPFTCWTQSWPPVPGGEDAEQAETYLVPSAGAAGSTSCPSSWGCGPSFGGCSFPCACLPLLGASSPGLICFFLPST